MFKGIDESITLEINPLYLMVMINWLFSITHPCKNSKDIWVGRSWALCSKLVMVVVGIRKDGLAK